MVVFGQSGCIRAKVVVFGQTGCIRAEVVLFVQKRVVFGQSSCKLVNYLYLGKMGSNWEYSL